MSGISPGSQLAAALDAADWERNRVIGLKALVAEILREVELGTLGQHTPAATTKTLAKTAEWRQRAGLEPAAVTAGAEHIALELLDKRLPDGPAWQRVPDAQDR